MLPLVLNLPFGYSVRRFHFPPFKNEKVYVGITTGVPLKHSDVTQACLACLTKSLKELRQLSPERAASLRKLVVFIEYIEVDGASGKSRVREQQQIEMNIWPASQRAKPDAIGTTEFDLGATFPESSATPQALIASPAWQAGFEKHRRVYGFISVSRSVIYLDPVGGVDDYWARAAARQVDDMARLASAGVAANDNGLVD